MPPLTLEAILVLGGTVCLMAAMILPFFWQDMVAFGRKRWHAIRYWRHSHQRS